MVPRKFKLALIQMLVKGGERDRNIRHAIDQIEEAASNGAKVALLPECLDLGWTHPSCLTLAEGIPEGEPCRLLMAAAKKHGIHVCAGLTEKQDERVYNSAVIIDRHGELLCRHRKLNELDIAQGYYDPGDRLNVAKTEFGTFGLMICADGFAKDHVLTRSLCHMGADVILSPCAWAVEDGHDNIKDPYGEEWRDAYMPVAKEFSTAIFGVSNVGDIVDGPWKGRKCIGCSLAINSQGEEILQGPYGVDAECILYIDVEPAPKPKKGTE